MHALSLSLSAKVMSHLPAATVDNPFDHTSPSLTVFGVDFSNKLYALLGGVWGLAVLYGAFRLIIAFMKFIGAKRVQHNPDAVSDASADLKIVALGLIGLAAISAIFAALVNLFG